MSIEWEKVKAKPDKPHKVLGQTLMDMRGKVTDLEANLQKKSSQLNENMTKLSTANNQILNLENTINEFNATIAAKDEQLAQLPALSSQITDLQSQLQGALAEKAALEQAKVVTDGEINALKTQVGEGAGLAQNIADLKTQLAQKDALLEQSTAAGQTKDQQIIELSSVITQKDSEIGESNVGSSQKDAQLENMQAAMTEKDQMIQSLNAKIEELSSDLSGKMQENVTLGSQLQEQAKVPVVEAAPVSIPEPISPPEEPIASYSMDSRIICPMCSATNIKDMEDKTKVLSYVGHVPIYAKKHVCRKCGYEF
ncbi:MAG: hypothetical protein ACTSWW_05300 [Promethearchaeota archaeon]